MTGSTPGLCDACIAKKKMVVTWGQSIHLGCAVKLPRPISLKDITWHHYSKDKGKYQIRYRYASSNFLYYQLFLFRALSRQYEIR